MVRIFPMFVWNQVVFEVQIDFWRSQRRGKEKTTSLSFSGHPMLIRKKVQQNSSWTAQKKLR